MEEGYHTRFQNIKKCMNYYKDLPVMLLPNKKRRVNIYIYIFKILPDHYHLHYYYRIIHQKK